MELYECWQGDYADNPDVSEVLRAVNDVGVRALWLLERPQDVQAGEKLGDHHDDHGEGDDELPGPRTAWEPLGDITERAGGGLGVLGHHQG